MGVSENNLFSFGMEGEWSMYFEYFLIIIMVIIKVLELVKYFVLCIVLVVVKNGEWIMIVNVLLDDGSIKIYINGDVVVELGLEGSI